MTSSTATTSMRRAVWSGVLPVVALGGLIGYLLIPDVLSAPLRQLLAAFCLGAVWAYLLIQWTDLIQEYWALMKDPVPRELEVASRAAVEGHIQSLSGASQLHARLRHLLSSWVRGSQPRAVVGLCAWQSSRARAQLWAGIAFSAILLAAAIALRAPIRWIWSAWVGVGLTLLARQQLLTRLDDYIECRLLARLPANLPQTSITAADLGASLGEAIREAFKQFVPSPEQIGGAVRSGLVGALQEVQRSIEQLQAKLSEQQKTVGESLAKALSASASELQTVQQALAAAASEIQKGISSGAEQWKAVLQAQSQALEEAVSKLPDRAVQAYVTGAERVDAALRQHAEQVLAAAQGLQAQLDRIGQLAGSIEKVLRVQETVEQAMKTVAASEEFRRTLEDLRQHLAASDALLKEATKPRIIRLVESEGEPLPT